MTPEGKVKAQIKTVLSSYENLWQHWAVQNGMGTPTLDVTGWYRGFPFAIEAKAPGKRATERQKLTMEAMRAAGAMVFEIDGLDGCERLRAWLEFVRN